MLLTGCAYSPKQSSASKGVVFNYSIEMTQKAAVEALEVKGFDVTKSDSTHVEGFNPRKINYGVAYGGETVGIWPESLGTNTVVRVSTAKSVLGIDGQKEWDREIVLAMKNILAKKQR